MELESDVSRSMPKIGCNKSAQSAKDWASIRHARLCCSHLANHLRYELLKPLVFNFRRPLRLRCLYINYAKPEPTKYIHVDENGSCTCDRAMTLVRERKRERARSAAGHRSLVVASIRVVRVEC